MLGTSKKSSTWVCIMSRKFFILLTFCFLLTILITVKENLSIKLYSHCDYCSKKIITSYQSENEDGGVDVIEPEKDIKKGNG